MNSLKTNKRSECTVSNSTPTVSGSGDRKHRTFLTVAMDIHLIRLYVEHNPYQLGKNQWTYISDDMKQTFGTDFLLRTLKDRTSKLHEKFAREELQYKTGTEEDLSELGNLLHELSGIIESSSASINPQSDAEIISLEEETNTPSTPSVSCPPSRTSLRQEKNIADLERDEYLNAFDMAPGPKTSRKRRSFLQPEDELIKLKQEQDHEVELKRLKLEEKKFNLDYALQREKLALEKEKLEVEKTTTKMTEEENKRRHEQQILSLQLQNKQMN